MFAREILSDVNEGSVKLQPRWLRVPAAVAYSGISRAKFYILLAEGQIKSASICARGKQRGIRVVDRLSIDRYLEKLTEVAAK
jgi:hypothetical protein